MADISVKSPDPMDIALGAAVRLRRRAIGMGQDVLAKRCGISFQQIQKYENGANRISFSRLTQIAAALQCRVVDLIDLVDGSGSETDLEFDWLALTRTPGALELLSAYEGLAPDTRAALVALLSAATKANFGPQ